MSRRVSRIHIVVVTTNPIRPMIENRKLIVVPITIRVIEAAQMTGSSVGPGRWISSPTGGVSVLGFAHGWT